MKKRKRRRPSRRGQNRQPVNQKHKDRLFRFAFQKPEDLLDLYNAINGTDYQNPQELKVTTLEDVVFLGVKNDLSFIIGTAMNLYEHQSTICQNMPLRGLIYFATLYQTYVKENGYDLYGSRRIELPFPNYIVFYNGDAKEPDETEMLLSDAFQMPDREGVPALECRVKVLNINRGHNQELMKRCQRLREYAEFIGCIKDNLKNGMDIQKAVSGAMDTCEKQGILTDLLARCRTEVLNMLLAEYDEKKTMEYIRREEREIGREEGERIGQAKGEQIGQARGEQIGQARGEQIGQIKGEARLSELLSRLLADQRMEDIRLAAGSEKERKRLYREYGLL